jgi:hypothetical protein
MAPIFKIHDLRLSFIWVETVTEPLEDAATIALFRKSWVDYIQELDKELHKTLDNSSRTLPWRINIGQHFWSFYFNKKSLGNVNPNEAGRNLIPLRKKVNFKLDAPDFPGRLFHETYLYPFGVSIVVNAVLAGDFSLDELVNILFKLRRNKTLSVGWRKKKKETLNLDEYAVKALALIKEKYLGKNTVSWRQSLQPFTVATFVRGSLEDGKSVQELATPVDDRDIQRVLEALVSWSPTWKSNQLPNLTDAIIPIKSSSPVQHLLYGRKRGRVVWFPQLIFSPKKDLHSLGCYHRNLLLVSVQVESLSTLIQAIAEKIRNGEGHLLSQMYENSAKYGAMILARLYGNTNDTFRSLSPRSQMEQNSVTTDLNDVLYYYKKYKLKK